MRKEDSSTDEDSVLTIDLTRRLPDVHTETGIPVDLERYGRFAIVRDGSFWFGDHHSSHPSTTVNGFYWATAGECLYLSPRGSTYRWKDHLTEEIVKTLAQRIGLDRVFTYFRWRE